MGLLHRFRGKLRALRFGAPAGIISQDDYCGRAEARCTQVAAPTASRWRPPRRFGSETVDFSSLLGDLPALRSFVVPCGRVLAPHGWVFTESMEMIRETSWYGPSLSPEALPTSFPAPTRIQGRCMVLASEFAGANYGHFVLDALPRMAIAAKAGWTVDQIDHFYVQRPPSPSARRLMLAIGVDEAKCIWADQVDCLVADELLVTTFPGVRRNYAEIVPETIRGLVCTPETKPSRLFIPRRGVRKLSNTDEIEGISREMGLQILHHDAVEDEFACFAAAELVVGPHGAGLANLAMCKQGTKVLELLPSDHIYPYYFTLSEAGGLDYSCLIGRSEGERPPGSLGPSPYDFHIDPTEYRSALARLMEELDERLA